MLIAIGTSRAQLDPNNLLLDSLTNIFYSATNEYNKLLTAERLTYLHASVDSTYKYSNIQLELAKKLNDARYEAYALQSLSYVCFLRGQYAESIQLSLDALVMADSIEDKLLTAQCYSFLGDAYGEMKHVTHSTSCYNKSLEILQHLDEPQMLADLYRSMGDNDVSFNMFKEAEKNYKKAIEIDEKNDFGDRIAEDYLGIGMLSYKQYLSTMYSEPDISLLYVAEENLKTSYNLSKKHDNVSSRQMSETWLASTMLYIMTSTTNSSLRTKEIIDSCRTLLNDSYAIAKELGYTQKIIEIELVRCHALVANKEYDIARTRLDSIKTIVEKDKKDYEDYDLILARANIDYYLATGDLEKAFHHMAILRDNERMSLNIDNVVTTAQGFAQNEFEKRLKIRELDAHREQAVIKVVMLASCIVALLVCIIAIMIFVAYYKGKKVREQLDKTNSELKSQQTHIEYQNKQLEKQNKIISNKNSELTDSINYAKIIQSASMPSEQYMSQIWGENVAALRPLRIVSGDFYWTTQNNEYKFLAVGDCAGHGVPGAFLSMMGVNLLDYLSRTIKPSENMAGQMLDEMRQRFKTLLHQADNAQYAHEGIDISLIIIDTIKMKMHFAGAFRPMILISEGKMTTIGGDRMPIGEYINETQHFTNHIIDIKKDDVIYLYTDGITDQFGYNENMTIKKYSAKRLREFLMKIYKLSFKEQKRQIGIEFAYWRMGDALNSNELYEQTDDALLVGVKV